MARAALAQQALPAIHLLLVEDSESDAFLVSRLLEDFDQADYKIRYAKTQGQAVEALTGQPLDVCLLDLTLPDAIGFSALIDIQDKAPDLPVLILTGLKDAALAKKAVGSGAQDYLLKDELKVAALARSIDYAIERKRMEKTLFEQARHDLLTGLANRHTFESHLGSALARAKRTGLDVAVLFLDLDRFKPINDRYGHDAGDEALKTVAWRLKKILRVYDMPARFGGDEFAVLLEGIGVRDAITVAQKIIAELNTPIPYRGEMLKPGASIGIVFSDGLASPEELLRRADLAMYRAKSEGGNGYRFYSETVATAAKNATVGAMTPAAAAQAMKPESSKARLKEIIAEKSYITGGDFTLASGASSSFFFDMKVTMLDPEGAALAADLILDMIKNDRVKAVGGLELGACPIASSVCALSHERGTPVNAFYVRKTPKKRGTQKMIEGAELKPGDRVVIVEDVTTSGGSALIAAKEVRAYGCEVVKVITLVDREQGAEENLKAEGLRLEKLFGRADFE